MATHYDVLGVRSGATAAQIRLAYLDKARQLHPDRHSSRPDAEVAAARRAMQDVNEAWRVLREPGSRAAYDRSLRGVATPSRPHSATPASGDDDWLDRPYPRRLAEPGDLTVAVVRAAPWIAVLVVLAAIFVFTAFARRGDDGADLIGKCITTASGQAEEVPCNGPNDGRVVGVVEQSNRCISGSVPKVVAGGDYYCVRPADSG